MTVSDIDPNFPKEVWPRHWEDLKQRGSFTIESIHRTKDKKDFPVQTHVKDAKKTPHGWESTYLGNGSLPLKEIISALDATGKRFPVCFEFPGEGDPEGAIRKSLEFMATLGR